VESESPRVWRLGESTYHLERPDLLFVELRAGGGTLREVTQTVALYQRLGTVRPFFILSDLTNADNLETDARHYIDKHVQPEWILGFIYINARLLHRATAMGLMVAYELTHKQTHPWRGKIHFVSTRAQARVLYARLRGRLDPRDELPGDALMVTLHDVSDEHLPLFFEHQRDPEALRMAAFSSRERDAFFLHWRTRVLRPENVTRTILVGGLVAGYIGSWNQDSRRLVGYWVGREHWGQGIASRALAEFLVLEPTRPLHAWVALHNVASIRVLEKCGFRTVAQPEQAHEDGIVEVLMRLDPP
jgi:RimJ/RimL family protein N-acetyltransferase